MKERLAGKKTARGGQEGSIRGLKLGTPDPPAQDRELVPKHHDLELLELVGAGAQQDELD
jgi:hypothetical protein